MIYFNIFFYSFLYFFLQICYTIFMYILNSNREIRRITMLELLANNATGMQNVYTPLPFKVHFIFCIIATLLYLVQFYRKRSAYYLLIMAAIDLTFVTQYWSGKPVIYALAAAAAVFGVTLGTVAGTIYVMLRHKFKKDGITKEMLEKHCDGEYIQWLGHRSDVLELLKQSHIMAFPSWYREGLPKSVIEAEAIGRPVVTTDSVGCRDTVIDGKNGFLIPIKDSDALAIALKKLIDNKELRQSMGRNAREFAVNKFDIKDVIDVHLDVYKTILE